MAACDYCGAMILFGGKKSENFRFCSDRCQQAGILLDASKQVPDDLVQQRIWNLHQGTCPQCQGRGPIDVHTSYRIWSALIFTSWRNQPHIVCRSCGTKAQLRDAAVSLLLGWWNVPRGLVMTPVQLSRNFAAIFSTKDPSRPSPTLEKLVRIELAAKLISSGQIRTRPGRS
jgi:endogenous inhibitor of DNA gyrase (YacG/DUF329 family)